MQVVRFNPILCCLIPRNTPLFFVSPTAIPDNRCLKMHVVSEMFPSETEYDVAFSLCFPEGLTKSFRSEIHKLTSEKAPNPKYEGDVINKWDFGENNPNLIVYQCEDSSNVLRSNLNVIRSS